MLFAVVALMVLNGAVAILRGRSVVSGQFPYFVLLETYKNPEAPVIFQIAENKQIFLLITCHQMYRI